MVDMVDINTNDLDRIKYSLNFLQVNKMAITKEFLKSGNMSHIGFVSISSEDFINESYNLTQEQINNIMFP